MFHRTRSLFWLLLLLVLPACDRDVTDPTLRDDDVDALLARAGLTPADDFTLASLLHDAIRTVQAERGTEAARIQLERVRAAGGERDSAELQQLAIVLEVLGPHLFDRASRETRGRLVRLSATIDTLTGPDAGALRAQHAAAVAALALATRAVDDSAAALLGITRAAELTADLRRALLLRNRVEALPELFRRARARIDSLEGDRAPLVLRRHAELMEGARASMAHGKRLETHRALHALRGEELRLTVDALGVEAVDRVVLDVTSALARLEPMVQSKPRTQRMHGAARDMVVRARRELERGRPEAALDLASHAAGLTNALMLAVTPR